MKYYRLPDLLADLELSRAQGTQKRLLKQIQSCDFLILDEFLLVPATVQHQQDLLEVLERRYRHRQRFSVLNIK